MERFFEFLTAKRGLPATEVAAALWRDFQRGDRGEMPPFLRPHLPADHARAVRSRGAKPAGPTRQSRHAAAVTGGQ